MPLTKYYKYIWINNMESLSILTNTDNINILVEFMSVCVCVYECLYEHAFMSVFVYMSVCVCAYWCVVNMSMCVVCVVCV